MKTEAVERTARGTATINIVELVSGNSHCFFFSLSQPLFALCCNTMMNFKNLL